MFHNCYLSTVQFYPQDQLQTMGHPLPAPLQYFQIYYLPETCPQKSQIKQVNETPNNDRSTIMSCQYHHINSVIFNNGLISKKKQLL